MFDNYFTFFILRFTVVLLGIIIGNKVAKVTPTKYWLSVFPFILIFSLNEGLRFGRGVDYNGYFFKYYDILLGDKGLRNISDPVFVGLCHLNDIVGMPYQGLIFFLSFFLVVAGSFLLREVKDSMAYAFPLFFLFSFPAENLIRWFFAFSFLMISSYFYNNSNYKKAIIFAALALGSHMGIIIPAFFCFSLKYLKKPIFSLKTSVLLYIGLWTLFTTDAMLGLVKYINYSSIFVSDYYSGYIDNADVWLTGNGLGEKAINYGIGLALPDIITLILTYYVVRKRPQLTYYANIYIVGALLSAAIYRVEIGYRISVAMKIYQVMFLAVAFKDLLFCKLHKNWILKLGCWILIINIIRVYFLYIYTSYSANEILYIWDSNGKDVLL